MKKIGMFSVAALFLASGAVAGDEVTQSESRVKEHITRSTTMQGDATQPGTQRSHSSTVEKQQKTTTSAADERGEAMTDKRVDVQEESTTSSTTEGTGTNATGSGQQHQQHSETHHQHSTTEVEKK